MYKNLSQFLRQNYKSVHKMQFQITYSLQDFNMQLDDRLYPTYVAGGSEQQILKQYEQLERLLRSFDKVDIQKMITQQVKQNLLDQLICKLNELCTYTHRIEVSNKILALLAEMTQNLKNLPVGRNKIRISQWSQQLQVIKLTDYQKVLKSEDQIKFIPKMTKLLDQIYLQYHRIPHLEHLLLKFPNVLFAFRCFEQQLMNNSKSYIPLDHKLFLGIIAASTYGSQYIWNRLVIKFRDVGGDMDWIANGLKSTSIPATIRILSKLSWLLAYDFERILSDSVIEQIQQIKEISSSFFLEGLFIIAYYQSLSCLTLVSGLTVEQKKLADNYLPQNSPPPRPSLQSFEAMYLKQKKAQLCQNEKAIDFFGMFIQEKQETQEQPIKLLKKISNKKSQELWLSSDQDNDDQQNQINNRKSISKATSDSGHKKRNTLSILAEQEAKLQKLKNMRTIDNIKLIYGKYLRIQQQQVQKESFTKFFKKPSRKNSWSSMVEDKLLEVPNEQKSKQFFKSISENSFGGANVVYASDWTFREDALTQIQNTLGRNFMDPLKNMLKALRHPCEFVTECSDKIENGRQNNSPQLNPISMQPHSNTKSRNRKVYYQMINNYLYEYVNYSQLVCEDLPTIQKNLIKLSTKSPFLFSEKAFKTMGQKMGLSGSKMLEEILQIISYKLELSFSMITLIISQLEAEEMI